MKISESFYPLESSTHSLYILCPKWPQPVRILPLNASKCAQHYTPHNLTLESFTFVFKCVFEAMALVKWDWPWSPPQDPYTPAFFPPWLISNGSRLVPLQFIAGIALVKHTRVCQSMIIWSGGFLREPRVKAHPPSSAPPPPLHAILTALLIPSW